MFPRPRHSLESCATSGRGSRIVVVATDDGFCNVDLEIGARSRAQLAPIIEQFEGHLLEMYTGRIRGLYRAHYESTGRSSIRGRRRYNPTTVIHELADVIERLNATARRAWKAAAMRDFNVGVEVARGVWGAEHVIDPDAVRRVAALQGRIVFTVSTPGFTAEDASQVITSRGRARSRWAPARVS